MRPDGKWNRGLADIEKRRTTEKLLGPAAAELRKVERHGLREAREIRHDEHGLVSQPAEKRQHLRIRRAKKFQRAVREGLELLANAENPPRPPEQGRNVLHLNLDIHRLVVELGIDDDREKELLRVRAGEACIAISVPLHGRAYAVAVAEVEIVSHADLVAVVEDRSAGQREEQRVDQLDFFAIVVQQRSEAAADAEIDASAGVLGVKPVHVVSLLVGDHFERKLVVVAQEDRPLTGLRDVRCLLEDVDDREAIFHLQRHEEPRHERKMERHVALVALAKIRNGVLRPLIRLGEEHAIGVLLLNMRTKVFQITVRLREILARGSLAFEKIRNRIQPQPVHAHTEPEVGHLVHRLAYGGVIEIQVRLVRVKAVPVVGLRHGIPRPVRAFEILENDSRILESLRRVAPYIKIPLRRSRGSTARTLEPRVLVGGMIDDEFGDDPQVRDDARLRETP